MKKNEVRKLKKLRLSRETLHALTSSDFQKVVGGASDNTFSCHSGQCDLCGPHSYNCVTT